jgi:hypothetical protein
MDQTRTGARRIIVLALGACVAWLSFGYRYHFLDGVNLLIHEAGHVVFGSVGQTVAVAGGTILQLAFPLGTPALRTCRSSAGTSTTGTTCSGRRACSNGRKSWE